MTIGEGMRELENILNCYKNSGCSCDVTDLERAINYMRSKMAVVLGESGELGKDIVKCVKQGSEDYGSKASIFKGRENDFKNWENTLYVTISMYWRDFIKGKTQAINTDDDREKVKVKTIDGETITKWVSYISAIITVIIFVAMAFYYKFEVDKFNYDAWGTIVMLITAVLTLIVAVICGIINLVRKKRRDNLGYVDKLRGDNRQPAYSNRKIRYLSKEAEKNKSDSAYKLGEYYYSQGLEQSYKEAVRWYTIAARRGHAAALNMLGVCYENGLGVDKNLEKAKDCYVESAEKGEKNGCRNLSRCYRNGIGVKLNSELAEKWSKRYKKIENTDGFGVLLSLFLIIIAFITVWLCIGCLSSGSAIYIDAPVSIAFIVFCILTCLIFVTVLILTIIHLIMVRWRIGEERIKLYFLVLTIIIMCLVISFVSIGGLTFTSAENSSVSSDDNITDGDVNNIKDIIYVVDENGVLTCEYIDDSVTEIIIPDEVDGTEITAIGEYAFHNCTSIESITIPKSVISIEDYAFSGCNSLLNVTFYAYSQLQIIAENAFSYCSSLESVTIPDNVTSIGSSAFMECSNLASVEFGAYSQLQTIGNRAFYNCSSITDISIPNSVITIGEYAFNNCNSLKSLYIGESIVSIGDYSFYGCTALTQMNFNAISCNDFSAENHIFAYAGRDCEGVVVNIKTSVTVVPAYLFYSVSSVYCPNVISIEFEENSNCISIGNYAFAYLSSIQSITIPDSVTSMGSSVFSGCSSLQSVTLPFVGGAFGATETSKATLFGYIFGTENYKDSSATRQYYYSSLSITYYIPISLTSVTITGGNILSGAFYNCSTLTSITIGENVTSIDRRAFRDCTSLTEINYYATILEDLSSSNYVFYNAGKNGTGIMVTIGANVTKVPAYLFDPYNSFSCSPKIVSVIFEEGSVCTSIGDYAFAYCTSLTSITIPDSVTSIGEYAFYNCTSLESVTFENIEGWWCAGSSTATSGTSISDTALADPSTAAKYLNTNYCSYYWKRI